MTIYDVDLNFAVSVNVTPLTLYTPLANGTFTHVRKIPVPFVSVVGGVNTWASHAVISNILDADILPDTDGVDTIILGAAFNPDAVVDTNFTEFTTDDLEEDMYDPNTWATAVSVARGLVNASISSAIFTEENYIKFTAGFDITQGITTGDGFGYVGTRAVTTASALDPLEGDDPSPRKLAIIFYQSSVVAAE